MISLRRAHILASNGIERELHPAGNPELVIDTAQVVPNRMFGNAHLLTELARAHALRQKVHDLCFAWCKKTHAATGLDNSEWFELREETQEEGEILVTGPDLPAVHRSNALGQQLERGNAVEDTSRTSSKRVDDQFTVANRNHHDRRCFRTIHGQALQDAVARHLPIPQMSINQSNI